MTNRNILALKSVPFAVIFVVLYLLMIELSFAGNKNYLNQKNINNKVIDSKNSTDSDDDDDNKDDDEDNDKDDNKDKNDKNNETNNNTQNTINSGFSDLGILKEVVEEKKDNTKKFDEEEDKIFLNKDIFNEKTKEKLRATIIQEKKPEDEDKFKISHRIISDLSFTDNFGSPKNKFYDTSGVIRYYFNVNFNKNFEFYSLSRLSRFDNEHDIAKRNADLKGGGSRTFENMGINLSEISLKYSKNDKSLIIGKFTANFGTAWRWNKAIFIHSVPQNYALTEKIGLAGIAKYGDSKKTGVYNLSFSIFTNDRKNFDNSLLHRKNSDNKSSAIAGDTRKLSSFVIANDIKFDFKENEKLSYHIAYSKLSINKNATTIPLAKIKKQSGIVFGMNYEFPIQKNINGEAIIESANIQNINGNSDISNAYLTSNFILKYQSKYSLMVGNSRNKNKNRLSSRSRNNISEINIGYEFNKNKLFDKLTTQIGYYQTISKSAEMSRKDKAFALLIRYYKNF